MDPNHFDHFIWFIALERKKLRSIANGQGSWVGLGGV